MLLQQMLVLVCELLHKVSQAVETVDHLVVPVLDAPQLTLGQLFPVHLSLLWTIRVATLIYRYGSVYSGSCLWVVEHDRRDTRVKKYPLRTTSFLIYSLGTRI